MVKIQFILVSALFTLGCTGVSEEELKPKSTTPDSPLSRIENVKLSTDINPIFRKYGCDDCHGAGSENGVVLTQYNGLKSTVENGSLLGSIRHTSGFAPMPNSNIKLTANEIETIKVWIDEGAKNN